MVVLIGAVIQAELVFGGAFRITRSSTLISYIKTVLLPENRYAVIVLVGALILA